MHLKQHMNYHMFLHFQHILDRILQYKHYHKVYLLIKEKDGCTKKRKNSFFILYCLIYFLDIKGLYRGAEPVLRRQISVLATNNLGHKWPVVPLYIPTKETWSFNMISRPNRAWFLFLIHWRQTCDHNIDIFFPTARLSSIWTLQINFITSAWNLFISFDFKN